MNRTRHGFQKVGKTVIIPVSLEVLIVFTCLLPLSNFTTNFISMQLICRELLSKSERNKAK